MAALPAAKNFIGRSPAVTDWINLQLKDRITGDLSGRRSLERGYFDPKYVSLLLNEHSRGRRDHSHALWTLWMLELWHRRYIDRDQDES
jgi:asparagine synthase (glutamine-hydrolysing)